ncbi:MAG: tRNA pseudouridine(55) synthase TruB, partial [Sphingomonadaceae bacterium]
CFAGRILQRPPVVSALKVAGRRAHELARRGEAVALAEREVEIAALELLATEGPPSAIERASLRVECSKGTYVRALARDLAQALGTLGHVVALRRNRSGPFGLDRAVTLDFLQRLCDEGRLADAVLPLAAGLVDIPAMAVTPDEAAHLRQGRRLAGRFGLSGLHVAMLGEMPVALVVAHHGEVRVERGFNLP